MHRLIEEFFLLEKWNDKKFAQVAKKAGWARSMIYAWKTGKNGALLSAFSDILEAAGYELVIRKRD